MAKRKINEAGLDIIKYFEGLRLDAYQDIGGIWTIGYGHTGPDVVPGQTITSVQADLLLRHDVEVAERIEKYIKPIITDNQFSACVSLAYNIGVANFESSTLLKEMNLNHINNAANEFLRWDKVKGKPVRGLLVRRKAERDLFLKDL